MYDKIAVIGSLNMDMVVNTARFPCVGETILGRGVSFVPGGKGANQAYAAGRLGGRVKMLGAVGDDVYGKELLQNLGAVCVDTSSIRKMTDTATGMAFIPVDQEGNNSIIVISGANAGCGRQYLEQNETILRESHFVLLQMEIAEEAVAYAIARASDSGAAVIVNPAPVPDAGMEKSLLGKIDYLTPNENEVIQLAEKYCNGIETVEDAARILVEKGVRNVIVTLGSKGSLWVDQALRKRYFPACPVKAVDTTAAGDCFNGAFVTALSRGRSIAEAIRFATCASALSVTRKGAQSSIPDEKEVLIMEEQQYGKANNR